MKKWIKQNKTFLGLMAVSLLLLVPELTISPWFAIPKWIVWAIAILASNNGFVYKVFIKKHIGAFYLKRSLTKEDYFMSVLDGTAIKTNRELIFSILNNQVIAKETKTQLTFDEWRTAMAQAYKAEVQNSCFKEDLP